MHLPTLFGASSAALLATWLALAPARSTPLDRDLAGAQRDTSALPECGHDREHVARQFRLGRSTGANFMVPGWTTSIPEFHDCQRFITRVAGRRVYDSLMAVFIRGSLDSVYAATRARAGAPGASARPTTTGGGGPAPTVPAGSGTTLGGVVVVGVVLAGNRYDLLGIRTGFNCLALTDAPGGGYDAYMVPVGGSDAKCLQGDFVPTAGTKLKVAVEGQSQTGVPPSDVPPVARWDREPRNDHYYIGVKCPAGWCEVHRNGAGFSSSHSHAAPGGANARQRRVIRSKGWFDEQTLGELPGSGKIEPTGPIGTAFPHPDLDGYQPAQLLGSWMPAAGLVLPTASTVYQSKFGASQVSAAIDWTSGNVLETCSERRLDFGASAGKVANCPASANVARKACASNVYARMRVGGTIVKEFCVTYRPWSKAGFSVPGVVRWRWKDADETVWYRCPYGCCEAEAR